VISIHIAHGGPRPSWAPQCPARVRMVVVLEKFIWSSSLDMPGCIISVALRTCFERHAEIQKSVFSLGCCLACHVPQRRRNPQVSRTGHRDAALPSQGMVGRLYKRRSMRLTKASVSDIDNRLAIAVSFVKAVDAPDLKEGPPRSGRIVTQPHDRRRCLCPKSPSLPVRGCW
jgi:hypothetical protein